MKWTEEYATVVERIDEQHKMLFRMTEDFRAALNEGQGEGVYGGLLESLDLYIRTHFRFEEACMDRYQCPAARMNRDAHATFVEVLSGFKQRYAASGFDRGDGRELVDTLDQWLADHIGRVDVQLRQSVQES